MNLVMNYGQVCLDAWMSCENLLLGLSQKKAKLSSDITKIIDECAHICLGTFHALKVKSCNLSQITLLCIGICEECAEICEEIDDHQFQQCAKACRNCSQSFANFTLAASN